MFFGRFTIRWRRLAEAAVLVRAPFFEFVHKLDAYVMSSAVALNRWRLVRIIDLA